MSVPANGGKSQPPYRLTQRIIGRSVADTWQEAKLEWSLDHIYFADQEPESCLCGKYPIKECCVILNDENGNTAVVGNCCVKRFLELPSHKLFAAVRRIVTNPATALSVAAVEYAYRQGWINDWERGFYLNTRCKRFLSANRRRKRVEINAKIWARVSRRTAEEGGCNG